MMTPGMMPDGLRTVHLTKRETEVLGLVAQGHTTKEAADLLYLSPRTVSFHLSQVYEKLDVTNRVQAFRAAARLGLIPEQPSLGG